MIFILMLAALLLPFGIILYVAASIADRVNDAITDPSWEPDPPKLYQASIIDEVRRQQSRPQVVSKNNHKIIGQQMRQRGQIVCPWEQDIGGEGA